MCIIKTWGSHTSHVSHTFYSQVDIRVVTPFLPLDLVSVTAEYHRRSARHRLDPLGLPQSPQCLPVVPEHLPAGFEHIVAGGGAVASNAFVQQPQVGQGTLPVAGGGEKYAHRYTERCGFTEDTSAWPPPPHIFETPTHSSRTLGLLMRVRP